MCQRCWEMMNTIDVELISQENNWANLVITEKQSVSQWNALIHVCSGLWNNFIKLSSVVDDPCHTEVCVTHISYALFRHPINYFIDEKHDSPVA